MMFPILRGVHHRGFDSAENEQCVPAGREARTWKEKTTTCQHSGRLVSKKERERKRGREAIWAMGHLGKDATCAIAATVVTCKRPRRQSATHVDTSRQTVMITDQCSAH